MLIILLVYLIGFGLLIVLTAGIIYRAFYEWQRPGARTLAFLMVAMLVWGGFYLLEIILPTFVQKEAARKAVYIGMTIALLCGSHSLFGIPAYLHGG